MKILTPIFPQDQDKSTIQLGSIFLSEHLVLLINTSQRSNYTLRIVNNTKFKFQSNTNPKEVGSFDTHDSVYDALISIQALITKPTTWILRIIDLTDLTVLSD